MGLNHAYAQKKTFKYYELILPKKVCYRLVRHIPDADVAFQPGVDVRGKPVVPANGHGKSLKLPDEIKIDITVDIKERFNIPPNSDLFDSEAKIGEVIFKNNQVYFNGQPLIHDDQELLASLCHYFYGS